MSDDRRPRIWVRISVGPLTGAEVIAWLLALDDCPGDEMAVLESFDGGTAVLLLPLASLSTAIRAAGVAGLPIQHQQTPEEPPAGRQANLGPASPRPAPPAGGWRFPASERRAGPGQPASSSAEPAGSHRRRTPLTIAGLAVIGLLMLLALFRTIDRSQGGAGPAIRPAGDGTVSTAASPIAGALDPAGGRALRRVERDRGGACIPPVGEIRCDPVRASLWSGVPAAWQAWSASLGEQPPADGDLIARVLGLRLAAGDPRVRIDLARAQRLPLPLIAAVSIGIDQAGAPRIEAVEIENAGVGPADLSGVAVLPLARVVTGFRLDAGERCGIGEIAPDLVRCPTIAAVSPEPVDTMPVARLRTTDGVEIDRFIVPR